MKNRLLLIFMLTLIGNSVFADIIMPNHHSVSKCIKITNIDEYPNIAVLAYIEALTSSNSSYLVSSTECLYKGYKFNSLSLYATSSAFLQGKDTTTLDLPNIATALKSNISLEPFGGTVADTDPTNRIEEYYKIVGFDNTTFFIYKWKQITGYNNKANDYVELFNNPINMSNVLPMIPTSTNKHSYNTDVTTFPNPAHTTLSVSINNSYVGIVNISLVDVDGRTQKSISCNKTAAQSSAKIALEGVAKGNYILTVGCGKDVTSSKVVVE